MAAAAVVGFPTLVEEKMDVDVEMRMEQDDGAADQSYAESDRSQYVLKDQWQLIANVIKEALPMLTPDEELNDLMAAEQSFESTERERELTIKKMEKEISSLTKEHEAAAQAAIRPSSHPPAAQHDAQVRELEHQQMSLGKSINEEEANVVRKEAELREVKAQREEVMMTDVGSEATMDAKVVRLKLLSDMGFSYVASQQSGTPAKVLIRNDAKLDVHSVKLENKRAKSYYANQIWSLLGE